MSAEIEEPQEGGSYIRNPDGSLQLVERTAPQVMRPERGDAQQAQPESPPADEPVQTPAPATTETDPPATP
jgi:hypothetical protein